MNGIELYIYNISRGYECEFVENCLNVFNERHNKRKQKLYCNAPNSCSTTAICVAEQPTKIHTQHTYNHCVTHFIL